MPATARASDGARARRLAALRAVLPPSPPWEAWLAAHADEAPPEFSRLSARPGLWSPVEGLAGPEGWPARRAAIRARWRRWVIGAMAPAPADLDVEVAEDAVADGIRVRRLVLRCARGRGVLRARLIVPEDAPAPPPVLLTQTNHEWWAAIAVRRGWAACLVSACDGDDDTDSLQDAYPGSDWSRLARRAWALSRALDALEEIPGIDPARVVLAGHSRNGKAGLIAAAHDERFAAVVSSSSGVMGAIPARLCADRHFGEGIELLTRHFPDWFHGRLRFFSGREHLLPTDAHELLALIAPRPLLLSVAVNDQVESTWAAERTHAVVSQVYALFGAEEHLTLRWRVGGHEASREAVEAQLDWAEAAVSHGPLPATGAPEPPLHPVGWPAWPTATATRPAADWAWRGERALRAAVQRALGAAPPSAGPAIASYGHERPHVAALLRRDRAVAGVEKRQVVTGEGVNVDLWLPAVHAAGAPLPLVLWLSPLCRATGYVGGYEQAVPLYEGLAREGWAVACHDPVGAGARVREERALAERHPGWSPLGRMVRDARAVLSAAGEVPELEAGRAWLVGYGTGALVGLHVAALDPRVAGAALVAPSSAEGLLPGDPERAPDYGLADLLASFGPSRPALVLSPRWDPEGDADDVAAAVRAAASTGAAVEHAVVRDYHRLSAETRGAVRAWLGVAAGRELRAAA